MNSIVFTESIGSHGIADRFFEVGHRPTFCFCGTKSFVLRDKSRGLVKKSEQQIADLLEPTINAMKLQLWGVEHISQGRYSVLRIYIENADGISIEDCEQVSRQVSAVLDVEDPIAGEYTLEVSSPGADRRLFTVEQFEQFIGSEVDVRLKTPLEGRRKFKGQLAGVTGEQVLLQVDGSEYQCPIEAIERANIVF